MEMFISRLDNGTSGNYLSNNILIYITIIFNLSLVGFSILIHILPIDYPLLCNAAAAQGTCELCQQHVHASRRRLRL